MRALVLAVAVGAAAATRATAAHADSADDCIASAEQSQPLLHEGKLSAARRKLMTCSRAECPSVVRNDCVKWLADADALMPSIIVRAVDSTGADVIGARVFIDGERQDARSEGKELEVDPGTHTLRLEHDGNGPAEQQIVVRESERHRIVSISFGAPASAQPSGTLQVAPSQELPRPTSGRSVLLPVVLVSAGGVGLAVASFLWVSGLSDRSTMSSGCALTHSCPETQIDSARGKLVAGDVLGGAGIVAAVAGLGLLIFGHSDAPQATPVALQPIPGGARLELQGRF